MSGVRVCGGIRKPGSVPDLQCSKEVLQKGGLIDLLSFQCPFSFIISRLMPDAPSYSFFFSAPANSRVNDLRLAVVA
jgi:hypothetical protein